MKRPLDEALDLLRSTFPAGRFFRHAPIQAGRLTHEGSEQEFVLVSIYEHRLSTHFRMVGGWPFIITNGFLSSHAYNLALAWLWHGAGSRAGVDALKEALRHNYKKFYAEAALGERNCLVGRAMLIETLLDQNEVMEPIFASAAADPVLAGRVADLQQVTAQIASHHEAGHYFIARGLSSAELSGELLEGLAAEPVSRIRAEAGPELAEELLCDLLALNFAIRDETTALPDYPPLARLRIAVLAFLFYGDLATLGFSARHGARQADDDRIVSLGSELRSKEPIDLIVVRQPDLARRTAALLDAAGDLASKWGSPLFGGDEVFALPADTEAILADAFDRFMEARVPPGPPPAVGTVGMARLLAEALHGHDPGAEHLLWRSKQFLVGGDPVDP